MSQRRVRLRVRQVGPRPPLPPLSGADPVQGGSSPTSGPGAAREPTRLQRFVRWYRRADLAKHTAVLAAAVAAASLAVTAWGTYKAAQVADDQLAQSRANNENGERAQASRISIWGEGKQSTRIVLANRSPDPVWAYAYLPSGDTPYIPGLRDSGDLLWAGALPPCTRLTVPLSKIGLGRQDIRESSLTITFMDANGRAWTRSTWGALLRHPELQNSLGKVARGKTENPSWVTEEDVEVKKLSECG